MVKNKLFRNMAKKIGTDNKVIWFTGLSGSGKTTLANAFKESMNGDKSNIYLLDGDILRTGLCSDLKFSAQDRKENIRRAAEVAKIIHSTGLWVICSFISPTNEIRNISRSIIGKKNYIEVFINSPIEICEKRDPKGLYKKARAGLLKFFTGIDDPFEIPDQCDLEIRTDLLSIEESVQKIYDYIISVE